MKIQVKTTVNASISKVWDAWTQPEHIVRWNFASQEWHCPTAEIDLVVDGKFSYRMEAEDGSMGFDFEGIFTTVETGKCIHYTLDDNRSVAVVFEASQSGVVITETFETESELAAEQQKQGWQNILNNFKSYVEAGGTVA